MGAMVPDNAVVILFGGCRKNVEIGNISKRQALDNYRVTF